MTRRPLLFVVAALIAVAAAVPVARAAMNRGPDGAARIEVQALEALGTGFTYQGRLTDAGAPANATYDIRFILYDAEAGGAQVGSTIEKADVAVTNGLFTVELDFGAPAFDGNARWLEIAIRPGNQAGAYTVLSPRQSINPVPYALYAKSAGLALPFTGTGTSPSTALVDINQTGAGIGIQSDRTGAGGATNPAIMGTNAGSGPGVLGVTTYDGGASAWGVVGDASEAADGAGGLFVGPTAVELDGALKVSGSTPTAFVHVASASSISTAQCGPTDHCTVIDNPLTNGDPDAILIVTQNWAPQEVYNPHPVGVWYDDSGRWEIFNEDSAGMPEGAAFNVLVIKR